MKGDAKVIEFLNGVLKNELTAINQYFLHSRMFANWGVSELAEKEYKESVDEMKHADMLVKRILFLDGLPNLQDLGKLLIGEDIVECLDCDLKLEMDSMPLLRDAIAHCEKVRDYVSRELFEKILDSEEEHVDWLETQKGLIDRIGVERFILLQSEPNEKGD
jgi:bacterioferritin